MLTGENQAASQRSDFGDEEKRLLKCIRHVSADASQREEKQFLYEVTQQFTCGINETGRSSGGAPVLLPVSERRGKLKMQVDEASETAFLLPAPLQPTSPQG